MTAFELKAPYQPAGGQPEAIAQLLDGVRNGLAGQTLLGVTGSGKSIGYSDPLYVVEEIAGSTVPRLVQAGAFIDELFEAYAISAATDAETERFTCASRTFFAQAYDPRRGVAALYPVAAFLRHRAPERMFRVVTACGREVTVTGDHNFWVLRQGRPTLLRTEDLLDSDYLPVPASVAGQEDLREIDILPYLVDSSLSVFAEEPILAYVRQAGSGDFVQAMRCSGLQPYAKLAAVRHRLRGRGIKVRAFLRLLSMTAGLGGRYAQARIPIGGKKEHCRLPAKFPLNDATLRLFGYYIAEGNAQDRCLIISNHNQLLRMEIESALTDLGIHFTIRSSSDYQISSAALTALLASLCGRIATSKRLPDFWPRLSDRSLGLLLRAYFDGDGTVGKNGEVIATTASKQLASDLAYALKRFGIHARLREVVKRAMNSSHTGGTYYQVSISGGMELHRFAAAIGFSHTGKAARLQAVLQRRNDTNVDVVPLDGKELGALRKELKLSMHALATLAGCHRPTVSMIESGKRRPSRSLLTKLLEALASVATNARVCNLDWWSRWRALRALCTIRWTPVRRVDTVAYSQPYVYDLSVPGPETFLAGHGGAFVHNTYTIANVIAAVQRPTLVLAPNKTLAAQLYGEFREYFPDNSVEYFVSYYDYYQPEAYVPSTDTYIEKDASINEHIEQMRLSATRALLERRDTIIVATVSSIYGLGDPSAYHRMVMHLVRGDKVEQRAILRRLAELQYTRNDVELHRATYRVRGEVIDVYPAESDREAVRVELFDDEIESLSYFDPLTGAVSRRVPRLTIYPKTHYVTERDTLLNAVEAIKIELRERLEHLRAANKLVEMQRLEQRTRFDLEMIMEVGYCSGIENYSRFLSGRQPGEPPPTLFDYLPEDGLLIVDESHVTIPQLGGMYRGDRARKENLVEYGFRLPSALDNRPLRFEEFERLAPQTVYVSATPGPYELDNSGQVVELVVRPTGLIDPAIEVRPASTQVDDLFSEITARVEANERVLVTTLTKRMAEDLTEYFAEHGIRVRYLHSDIETVERVEILRDLRLGAFDVLVGINLLREGLDLPEVSLVAILDADKEGFLRSERSLIQTVGRAARNMRGKAILYADRVTGSMEKAMAEMDRRRQVQLEFNREHGITPKGIEKAVTDIMQARGDTPGLPARLRKVAEPPPAYAAETPEVLMKKIKQLEERMYKHARDLEFEEAASLRDQIDLLRTEGLGLPARKAV